MRVTSDPASALATGITANTIVATAAVLVTDQEGAAPRGEGHTATTLLFPPLIVTRCKLGLHSSHMGGGAMLSPVSICSLSESIGQSR